MQLLLQTDNFPPHRPCMQDHTPAEWVRDPWICATLSGSHVKHRAESSQPFVLPRKSPDAVGPVSEASSKSCSFLECNIGVSAPPTNGWQQVLGRNSCLGVLFCCDKQAHSSDVPLHLDNEDLLFIQACDCQIPVPSAWQQSSGQNVCLRPLCCCTKQHCTPVRRENLHRCICRAKACCQPGLHSSTKQGGNCIQPKADSHSTAVGPLHTCVNWMLL